MVTPQQDTLARTLWGEARGEGREGMCAVAQCVLNRVAYAKQYLAQRGRHHPLYGDGTVSSCCLVPFQFSCWNPRDPNRVKLLGLTDANADFRLALEVADEAILGELPDLVDGATHYHTASIHPNWAVGREPVAVVGHHVFYDLGITG